MLLSNLKDPAVFDYKRRNGQYIAPAHLLGMSKMQKTVTTLLSTPMPPRLSGSFSRYSRNIRRVSVSI